MNLAKDKISFGWVGFHSEGIPALKTLLLNGYRPDVVLTLRPDALSRRSSHVNYFQEFKEWNLSILEIGNINDEQVHHILKELDLDVLFVIGWSQILKPDVLKIPRLGVIGAHASKLPALRGSAPVNWAIIKGLNETGNTLMWLDPGVDEGEIIAQTSFDISPYDTCATVYEKVGRSNADMILDVMRALQNGEVPRCPQLRTFEPPLPRRKPEDGRINWDRPAREVYDFVRALTRPYPGAFSFLEGEKYLIWSVALLDGVVLSSQVPGRDLGASFSPAPEACGQIVSCSAGAILILEAEDSTGKLISGRALSELKWKGKQWDS